MPEVLYMYGTDKTLEMICGKGKFVGEFLCNREFFTCILVIAGIFDIMVVMYFVYCD